MVVTMKYFFEQTDFDRASINTFGGFPQIHRDYFSTASLKINPQPGLAGMPLVHAQYPGKCADRLPIARRYLHLKK
jgi:hypothetical protein